MGIQAFNQILTKLSTQLFPILNILVPHTGHRPWVASLPFFIVMLLGCLIRNLIYGVTFT